MCAFADPVGIAITDKATFKEGFNEVTEGMMNDAITKGGGTNKAAFGFMNSETNIPTRAVGFIP
jgi:hypothetical protein